MLPEGTEMVMPGDNTEMVVELQKPIAMEEGLRFAIREGGRTVGAGRVIKITQVIDCDTGSAPMADSKGQKIRIRLKAYDHEIIDQSTKKIVETVVRTQAKVRGPGAAPDGDPPLLRGALAPRRQGLARALRDADPQAPLDIVEPTSKTVESLQRLDLPAGVDIEIKIQQA